jgi:hypothetical protein
MLMQIRRGLVTLVTSLLSRPDHYDARLIRSPIQAVKDMGLRAEGEAVAHVFVVASVKVVLQPRDLVHYNGG